MLLIPVFLKLSIQFLSLLNMFVCSHLWIVPFILFPLYIYLSNLKDYSNFSPILPILSDLNPKVKMLNLPFLEVKTSKEGFVLSFCPSGGNLHHKDNRLLVQNTLFKALPSWSSWPSVFVSPQISVHLVRPLSRDVQPSPLLSTALPLFCPPPSTSSHYIFIPACSLNSGDLTSKNIAGSLNHHPPPLLWASLPAACSSSSSSSSSSTSSLYLPGLSQGMKPPSWDVIRGAQPAADADAVLHL